MIDRRLLFAHALALVLAACSGGGGAAADSTGGGGAGGTGSGIRDAHIVNDTAGGAGGRLYARLNAIALEDDQGQLTGNLVVGGNPEFVLSEPLGEAFGLALQDFGPGTFVAVHVSFLPGSLKFKEGAGTPVDVALVGGSIRAPFGQPLEVQARGAYRIALRHASRVVIDTDPVSGARSWTPDMIAAPGGAALLRDANIEIMSVDAGQGTAVGVIGSLTGLRTKISFLTNAVLVLDGEETSVKDFLGGLKANDVIRVFALLDGASNTKVAFAERVDPLDTTPGKGRKNKVRGTITAVDGNGGGKISVRLFEIQIGGRDIPKEQRVDLSVDASSAKIKYVPRYGRHGGHLDAKDLAPDMFVEVEWHGAAPRLEVRAHKINIRSDGRFDFLQRIAGVVKAVDTNAKTITVRKADAGDYWFGKERYAELKISLGGSTILVADTDGVASELALSELKVAEQLAVLGRKQSGAEIAAVLVVAER